MKASKDVFDIKFLNRAMYIGVIIGVFYILKNLGVLNKAVEALLALTPVYIGLIICWICIPLTNRLIRIGIKKNWAAIISLVIIYGILALFFALVIPLFVEQISSFIKDLPNICQNIINNINDILHNTFNIQAEIKLPSNFNKTELFQKYGSSVLNYSINTVAVIFNVIIGVFTSIVVSFFVVRDIDKFKSGIILFFSKNAKNSKRHKMLVEIDNTLMSYIKGIVIDSVIVGIMTTLVCLVLGIDYALVFGILITLLNTIPYIGAIVSELIASLYALTIRGASTCSSYTYMPYISANNRCQYFTT